MAMRKIGSRVRIIGGEFFCGQSGTIIDTERYGRYEPPYYRIRLDVPVDVPGVGRVTDDLWQGRYLATLRR